MINNMLNYNFFYSHSGSGENAILHILEHALEHTLWFIPFLFAVFLIIEIIETKNFSFVKKKSSKNTGPTVWAIIGIAPHCGFGIMGAKLFSRKFITMGSLIAILISITDEAVFLLLRHPNGFVFGIRTILIIVAIKFIYAIIIGHIVDFIFNKKREPILDNKDQLKEVVDDVSCTKDHRHGHNHESDSKLQRYLLHPLKHSIPLIIFIFIIYVSMETIVHIVGEETFEQFFYDARNFQPLLAVLLGLIPNCVGSIVLINLYMEGVLVFPALIAGLIIQAGVSTLILFKENKSIKENLLILGIMIVSGLFLGYVLLLFS